MTKPRTTEPPAAGLGRTGLARTGLAQTGPGRTRLGGIGLAHARPTHRWAEPAIATEAVGSAL